MKVDKSGEQGGRALGALLRALCLAAALNGLRSRSPVKARPGPGGFPRARTASQSPGRFPKGPDGFPRPGRIPVGPGRFPWARAPPGRGAGALPGQEAGGAAAKVCQHRPPSPIPQPCDPRFPSGQLPSFHFRCSLS